MWVLFLVANGHTNKCCNCISVIKLLEMIGPQNKMDVH